MINRVQVHKSCYCHTAESIKAVEKKAEEEGRKSNLKVICIPSSFQAKQLIRENNLTLGTLDNHPDVRCVLCN